MTALEIQRLVHVPSARKAFFQIRSDSVSVLGLIGEKNVRRLLRQIDQSVVGFAVRRSDVKVEREVATRLKLREGVMIGTGVRSPPEDFQN